MTDRTSGDKAGEKSFFARTAKNTQKKAKRAQEKVKRKLGKSDETKDEFFDRFVENFNKQQDAVQSLQKELKNYINCIKAMLNANQLFSEAVKQVYEPEWSGRETFVDLLDVLDKNWNNLVQKLQDEVLEPLTSYQMQFPDTKNRISKRSRKVVDYDRHRHHLETLKVKGGKAVDPKKLSQSEEDYNQAKTVYLQLHSDLYEELPALYDSRISFYVSSFQSIFTAEGVFHQQTAKMKTQMSDLLDVLAKETSAGAYSTRRPVSVISNASSDGENSSFENFSKFEQTDNFSKFDHTDNSENAQSENEEVDAGAIDLNLPEQSTTDVDAGAIDLNLPEQSTTDVNDNPDEPHSDHSSPNLEEKRQALPSPPSPPPPPPTVLEEPVESPPSPNTVVDNEEENEETPVVDTSDTLETAEDPKNVTQGNEQEKGPEEEKGSEEEKASDVEHESSVLYKVVATHPYTGEDEDELTFEKGEVIHVVSYDDSDDPDDGWLMGVMQSTGVRGVFPGNFTKMMDSEEPS